MLYELWDTTTGNLVGNYPSEREALSRVRDWLDAGCDEFAQALALDGPDVNDYVHQIAEGEGLVHLARGLVPA